MKIERVLKYEKVPEYAKLYDEVSRPCVECKKLTQLWGENLKGETFPVCRACQTSLLADVKYSVRITTVQNLKNHFGMGNQWLPSRPGNGFFDGVSGRPDRWERIDFSSHELFATVERAQRDGLIQ
jgi:hypothetical protein